MKDISLTLGAHSLEELLAALAETKVQLNAHAPLYMLHPSFAPAEPCRVTVRILAAEELGFKAGAPYDDLKAAARAMGLSPCPCRVGPYLRLALTDQAESTDKVLTGAHHAPQGAIHIMSEKLTDNPDFPRGLYLRNMDGTLWLRGYVCSDDYPFPADTLLAFCVD